MFSKWVRYSRADRRNMVPCFTCEHYGNVKKMHAGHWIPRQHKSTRWAEWNVHPQCYACNMYYGGRPQDYRDNLVKEHGVETVDAWALERHKVKQWTRDEMKEMIDKYTGLLEETEAWTRSKKGQR